MANNEALALIIKSKGKPDRYYYGLGKKGQILTAWCLSGAELYSAPSVAEAVKRFLVDKGKDCQVVSVKAGC